MRSKASNTKVMSALIPYEQRQAVLLDGEPLEDVDKLKLGSMFVANGQGTEEIRINLARLQSSIKQKCARSCSTIAKHGLYE